MKQFNLIILLFAIALLFASCKKNKDELPIVFKFRLLDTLGNEKTVFNQGENIIFSFIIENNSSDTLMLENFFPNNDFFRVYKLNTDEGKLNLGIPYDGYYKSSGFFINSNNILRIEYPWNGASGIFNERYWIVFGEKNNPSLQTGMYETSFSQSFTFKYKNNTLKTEEKQFKINFTVK